MHLHSLQDYYRRNPQSLRIFVEIVNNRSTVVSLRLLDWLVTNFVTARMIPNETPEQRNQRIDLFYTYSRNLDSYTKVWFDPFARKSTDKGSIKFLFHTETCEILEQTEFTPKQFISTTVGQLNFFKIAIETGIIQYIFDNHSRIQTHMLEGLAERKRTRTRAKCEVYLGDTTSTTSTTKIAQQPFVPIDPLTVFSNDPTMRFVIIHPNPN